MYRIVHLHGFYFREINELKIGFQYTSANIMQIILNQ